MGIYFAKILMQRYPDVFRDMIKFLIDNDINGGIIENTENVWCRDYMPIPVNNHFIKFRYKQDFKKYPQLKVSKECYDNFNYTNSKIILEGGNVVRCNDKIIMTEMIFEDNPKLKISKLENLLEGEITLIPIEPFDDMGHADGAVSFIDSNNIIVNNNSNVQPTYYKKLIKSLNKYNIHEIINAYNKIPLITEKDFRILFPEADTWNPGFGYYINFVKEKDVILLPKFNIKEDEIALKQIITYFPNSKVKQIDCSSLSMEGGLVHCVSWQTDNVC